MTKKSKYEFIKIIAVLVSAAIITSLLTESAYFFAKSVNVYKSETLNASFTVANKKLIGISADQNVLNFGIVPIGGSSTKELILYHEYYKPLIVKITYSGNISKYLSETSPLYVEPRTEKRIIIIARAGEEYGNFTGTVKITYLKK